LYTFIKSWLNGCQHYKKTGKVIKVNGIGNVEEIFASLCKEIELKIKATQT
jgi:adenylate kinase family enzyme